MAGSVNRCILVGNVGKDPEIRSVGSGKVANLSLATSETWRDKATGERKSRTEWHRVTVWGDNLVKVIENYVKKGSLLYIEGSLQTRKYEKDGQERYVTEVVLQGFNAQIVLLDARKEGASDTPAPDYSQAPAKGGEKAAPKGKPKYGEDDSIPF